MERLTLNGKWLLRQTGKNRTITGTVPGDIYGDLLAAKQIPDPFYRDNELGLQWIGESDWSYSRTFTIAKSLLNKKYVMLRCEGLDTFASILINGKVVARTDNMFRTFEWDIKDFIKPGRNTIQVDFASVMPFIREHMKDYPAWTPFSHSAAYAGWVRKEQCNFGWDWGIKVVTCGIWKPIEIVAFDEGRIADVEIRQEHGGGKSGVRSQGSGVRSQGSSGVEPAALCRDKEAGGRCVMATPNAGFAKSVGLTVRVGVDRPGRSGLQANVSVSLNGNPVTSSQVGFRGKQMSVELAVADPQLWWPNNMGKQPLYDVAVELLDCEHNVIDSCTKRIGLRTIELDRHDDEWGESFQFKVNGVPFFAKGANWIPVDAVLARRKGADYRRLIQAAADCNMNMLRVWGGGIYEDDVFYDICDELGICVWQDFMFACAAYPTFMNGFLDNVKAEVRDAVKRLGHHPSLTLWCGNNELEMMNVGDEGWEAGKMPWKDYCRLFDELIPAQVRELSPGIPYWPSSPHSPRGDRAKHRNHLCGDVHLWIMSGRYPLDCARGMEHRFASEFGFQSFPEPRTISSFTAPEDRNVFSRIMEHHQRAPNGNASILQQLSQCFRLPVNTDSLAWVSQIMQGGGVKAACEHFRRSMPRAMGALYWQINDCWPVASWSSIDYYGRWKALQYMARHFFAPVLISGVFNENQGTVDIHLTSDLLKRVATAVSWVVTDLNGTVLAKGRKSTRAPANGSAIVKTLKLQKILDKYTTRKVLVWLDADVDGGLSRHNLVLLAPPKHMDLSSAPGIRLTITGNRDGSVTVELVSGKVALWTWVELDGCDAMFSDNFFHLRPGVTRSIRIEPGREMTVSQIKKALVVRSLVDTY